MVIVMKMMMLQNSELQNVQSGIFFFDWWWWWIWRMEMELQLSSSSSCRIEIWQLCLCFGFENVAQRICGFCSPEVLKLWGQLWAAVVILQQPRMMPPELEILHLDCGRDLDLQQTAAVMGSLLLLHWQLNLWAQMKALCAIAGMMVLDCNCVRRRLSRNGHGEIHVCCDVSCSWACHFTCHRL